MHDTDAFARMPALDSPAEQPPLAELIPCFEKQSEVSFKYELYLVRDNGAVFRRCRPQGRRRPLDEIWTFGKLNRHSGYFEINGHVVHRIVATAFHGPGPSAEYVVDHIDTNRQNNRADNLRWVTRLENILLNPITRARIAFTYGSVDAFLENPGAVSIPNWEWMRVVTKEQAQESRKRLLAWSQKGQVQGGGALGEWLYRPGPKLSMPGSGVPVRAAQREASEEVRVIRSGDEQAFTGPALRDIPSLTPGAVQRKWRTPTAFPLCPAAVSKDAMKEYLGRLVSGAVFARNSYGESTVLEAAIAPDGALSVVCNTPSGIRDWTHARVIIDGGVFCHESGGTFFERNGAMKAHCLAIGAPAEEYEGSFDDFC
ncbi:MAG: HNH endonuclease [Rhizobiales bacterium]|nr:HNH endonuclease [Hyphomicrobiales bacterium]